MVNLWRKFWFESLCVIFVIKQNKERGIIQIIKVKWLEFFKKILTNHSSWWLCANKRNGFSTFNHQHFFEQHLECYVFRWKWLDTALSLALHLSRKKVKKTAETKRSKYTLNEKFCYVILRLRIALYLVGKSNIQLTSFELNVIQRIPPIHAQTLACACTFWHPSTQ